MILDPKSLSFLAAMFVFWAGEFAVLAFWRLFMIRDEIMEWCNIDNQRKRVIALLAGLAGLSVFMFTWVARGMVSWMSGRWNPADVFVFTLMLGMVSIMATMWWACCAVLGEARGNRVWWINLWIGLAIGAVSAAYKLT